METWAFWRCGEKRSRRVKGGRRAQPGKREEAKRSLPARLRHLDRRRAQRGGARQVKVSSNAHFEKIGSRTGGSVRGLKYGFFSWLHPGCMVAQGLRIFPKLEKYLILIDVFENAFMFLQTA